MPSRNRVPNAAELVSRSLNCTRAVSPCERSDMVNASRQDLLRRPQRAAAYDEQIIARSRARVQPQRGLWFPARAAEPPKTPQKKSRRFRRLLKLDNREASNRVDRSHSVSKEDNPSHNRESLINRKRGIFFSLHLPCRPLADLSIVTPGLVRTSPAMTRKLRVPPSIPDPE